MKVASKALFAVLAVVLGVSGAHAMMGGPGAAAMDPAMLRSALLQMPGTTPGCVDMYIAQLDQCESYFGKIAELFPDLEAADGTQLLSYVINNPPSAGCCTTIENFNAARCICEEGTLPIASQLPDRYWGLLEAGRCSQMTSPIITPAQC